MNQGMSVDHFWVGPDLRRMANKVPDSFGVAFLVIVVGLVAYLTMSRRDVIES